MSPMLRIKLAMLASSADEAARAAALAQFTPPPDTPVWRSD